MGYNIGIGELKTEYVLDDEHIYMKAAGAEHPDAPDLGKGDISGKGNYRYPSYTVFSDWCKKTELEDVFYDDERRTLKGGHPGCIPLSKEMRDRVRTALENYKRRNPAAILPTPENTAHLKDSFDTDPTLDYTLGRLVWFDFWMNWAIENCKQPVISNS